MWRFFWLELQNILNITSQYQVQNTRQYWFTLFCGKKVFFARLQNGVSVQKLKIWGSEGIWHSFTFSPYFSLPRNRLLVWVFARLQVSGIVILDEVSCLCRCHIVIVVVIVSFIDFVIVFVIVFWLIKCLVICRRSIRYCNIGWGALT